MEGVTIGSRIERVKILPRPDDGVASTHGRVGLVDPVIEGRIEVGGTYYRYKNRWFDASNDAFPTNPTFAAGTAFGLAKAISFTATSLLYNQARK